MEREFWLSKWEKHDIPFHHHEINKDLIKYFNELNLQHGDSIFVPLCGKTKDMIWLANRGLKVIGIELSPIACAEFFTELNVEPEIIKLEKFTKYQHGQITIYCGDLFDIDTISLPTIKAVYDCKAFIALPPDLRKKYVAKIINVLGKHIHILLLTIDSDCDVISPPFPIKSNEVNLLYKDYFNIIVMRSESKKDIPKHLCKKGYQKIIDNIYIISGK